MKTNHQRNFVARQDYKTNYFFRRASLKEEGNVARRRMDAEGLVRFLKGDEDALFAFSDMGNPWHWD